MVYLLYAIQLFEISIHTHKYQLFVKIITGVSQRKRHNKENHVRCDICSAAV